MSPCNPVDGVVSTASPVLRRSPAGGDTIWLARHEWQVAAVDISVTAIDRVCERARELDLGDRVTAEQHDLARTFPGGEFDLVCALYLHTPFTLLRSRILRTAARALRPGGMLLIVTRVCQWPMRKLWWAPHVVRALCWWRSQRSR